MQFFLFFSEIILLSILSKKVSSELTIYIYKLTKNKKLTVYILAFIFFPGTVLHEMSHFLVSNILFIPASQIELFPQIEKDHVKLGSVAISKCDPFRRFIIGVAPFITGLIVIFSIILYSLSNNIQNNILLAGLILYALFQISNTMFLSKEDLSGAVELAGAFLIIFLLIYFSGFLPKNIFDVFKNKMIIDYFNTGVMYLLVPLLIDVVIIIGIKAINRIVNK